MNNALRVTALFFVLSAFAHSVSAQRIMLNDGWFLSSGARNMDLPVDVPGSLYGDLLKHGLVADVMKGNHEGEIQWIETGKWIYTRTVRATDEILSHKHIELVFEGLDTYAKVYVNDSLVITALNMFREWRTDIRGLLHKGRNSIRVEFLPAADLAAQTKSAFPYRLPQTDTAANAISSFVRKSAYHFGWDWAPRIPDRGIWRPVYLELWNDFVVRSYTVHTLSLKNNVAEMEARLRIVSDTSELNGTADLQGKSFPVKLQKGESTHAFRFEIRSPELWWPNGSGKQVLNDFKIDIRKGTSTIVSAVTRTGIRTIELVQEPDSIGTSFYFKVNGVPLFMQGANYVPPYTWNKSGSKQKLIDDAAAVGMNMLRVWGGGVYEDEAFYNRCDEKGILIWQDLMFACAMYPGDSAFIQNVQEEVRQNATRISAHPCLAIWCGNNESDVAWKNWGWQQQYGYSKTDSTAIAEAYRQLFVNAVPDVLKETDPLTAYIHTSPLSNWGKKENFNHHNMHYWGVWHGEEPIDSFAVNVPRFMSEYGMQSYPSYRLLQEAAAGDSLLLSGDFLTSRQKSYKGNRLLFSYIVSRYREPKSAEELCYFSQLFQADALSLAIQSQRLDAGRCMGTLYWQFNDVWPGASWSTIEYNGEWKAAHYALKKLYAKSLIIAENNDKATDIWFQTFDTVLKNVSVEVFVFDNAGVRKYFAKSNIVVKNMGSVKVAEYLFSEIFKGTDKQRSYMLIKAFSGDSLIAQSVHNFVDPGLMNYTKADVKYTVKAREGMMSIIVTTDVFLKSVRLSVQGFNGHFSENYFDLLPGEEKEVLFFSKEISPDTQVNNSVSLQHFSPVTD